MSDSDGHSFRKPDGTSATPEEFLRAFEDVGRAKDDQMSCPEIDCSGRIEASVPLWIDISPLGMPSLHAIGWFEGGKITCSEGGEAHVSGELERRLYDTMREFCAAMETRNGASTGEDRVGRDTGVVHWVDESEAS